MLANGVLLRIDRSSSADATGEKSFSPGADLAELVTGAPRCFLDEVSDLQRWSLGSTIKDASQVCFIADESLSGADESPPAQGDRMVVELDAGEAWTGEAIVIKHHSLSGFSHFEVYLKKV